MDCEILLIGFELLNGKIQDTNGKWIIEQLLQIGVRVSRITTIGDIIDDIKTCLQDAIKRKPAYLFTSGGLGPTFDDMTLEGVTQGLNPPQPLEENPIALEMVKTRYIQRFPNKSLAEFFTPARRKMATLPRGSIPLTNREGTAPGVYIPQKFTNGETIIICLPGIPSELKAIFGDHCMPEISQKVKNLHFYQCSFTFYDVGESKFTEKVYQIKDQYPEIWIKTHPKNKERMELELHLTCYTENPNLQIKMRELYQVFREHVIASKGIITEEHPLPS